jgi:hypothetical protein
MTETDAIGDRLEARFDQLEAKLDRLQRNLVIFFAVVILWILFG